jgi:ABC-type antimicrobial peptide transport system permease subunit
MRLATYPNRMAAWLTTVLGGLALLLTAVGIYGLTAYSVSRRTREIGVRMALGARRNLVFASVLRDGLKLAGVGLLAGAGLAVLIGRAMSGLLYGVKGLDSLTLAAVAIVILVVSVGATIGPARRALCASVLWTPCGKINRRQDKAGIAFAKYSLQRISSS